MTGPGDRASPGPGTGSSTISALLSELAESPDRSPEELLPELSPGDVVAGRFELRRELGRGGFGLVFEALDRELSRPVAFKAIRPVRTRALAKLAKPLKEEAEAVARLNHPAVVTLHDSGVHDGTPYLIMELLRGETLAARLRRGPLSPPEALRLLGEVARGLAHAHAHGVLHRDLKPGNVFLTEQGAVKLVDFGLASIMGRASLAAGTPAYMAPEQFGGGPEDERTDVFGAAVVLFEALTGTLPYAVHEGRSAVLEPGPSPRLPLAGAPPELVAFLGSALSRDPQSRPQDARAFLEGLATVELAYAAQAAAAARAARRRRVRRALWAASALAVLAAAAVTASALRARAEAERALRTSRLLTTAEESSDPLTAVLLLAELPDDAPPRAIEVAQRVLGEPIPVTAVEGRRGGWALAVSPDGQRVAVAQWDGDVTLHRADGVGAPLVLHADGRRVNDVAFTPDGGRLVAAGHEGDLHLHALQGRGRSGPVTLGTSPLSRVRVSASGALAAAASLDGHVWLVSLEAERVLASFLHDAAVLDLAFAPDGAALATGDAEGVVRLSDAGTGAVLARRALEHGVEGLAFSPDGARLAVACDDGLLRILDRGLRPIAELGPPGPALVSVAWAPDGRRLAAAAADGTLRLHPAGGGEPRRWKAHPDAFRLAFAPRGDWLLTVGSDGQAAVWPAQAEGPSQRLGGTAISTAAFTPDGLRIVTRSRDGAIRTWAMADLGWRDVIHAHADLVDTVAWSRDGARLLTAGHDGTAAIFDRATGERLLTIQDPGHSLHSAAWDPEERLVLTASEDGVARIWRAGDGQLVRALPAAGAPVLFAAWSPDGARLATAGLDGVVRVFAADGRGAPVLLEGHEAGVTHVTFSPDGRTVISASQLDATVRIWPSAGGPARVLKVDRPVYRAGLSPDGALLAVAEVDGPVRLFRVADLGELPPIQAWPDRLWSSAWSPDGRRLALTSFDGSYRVVPLGAGEPLVIRGHQGLVTHVAFRPDGREIASVSADGTIRIVAVDWRLLRERLGAATGACLGAAPRMHLLGEGEAVARARHDACERRHGREPPVQAPGTPPPSRADARGPGRAETDRRGT